MDVRIDGVLCAPVSIRNPYIGVAITTHNRPDVLAKSLAQHLKHLPAGAEVVVIDDGSAPAAAVPDGVELITSVQVAKFSKPIQIVVIKGLVMRRTLVKDYTSF
ncbi:hypothetical protein A9993_19030 [Rahnella victoriana]|nr:hypothetical protein A9993_19030 [Rahnella victoriana]